MAYSNTRNQNRNYEMFWYPNNGDPIRYEDMEFSHLIFCLGKLQKRKEQNQPIFSEVAFMRLLQEIEVRVRKAKVGLQAQAQNSAPTPEPEPTEKTSVVPMGQPVDLDQIPF